MIANPLQIFGHQEDIQQFLPSGAVRGNLGNQFFFNLIKPPVHHIVVGNDLPGLVQIQPDQRRPRSR